MQEQVARTVGGIVDALKTQPLCLALVLMNAALLGYLYYQGANDVKERKSEFDMLYRNRREVSVLLARCNWPEGQPLPRMFEEDGLERK